MSAGALVISDREIHLMSDGIKSYKDSSGNWKVKDRNTNKIKIINDRCGLLWLGAGLVQIWKQVETEINRDTLGDPWEVAHVVSNVMQSFYRDHDVNMGGRVNVVGFEDGRPVLYEITSYNDFQIQPTQLRGIYAWAMVHGSNNDNPFPDLVGKYLQQTSDLQQITRKAFSETVRQYSDKDQTVGGSTFYHRLSKKEQPYFMHTAELGKNTGL